MDATIISASSATKNASGKGDPEVHQTKKGNTWHFGMKLHVGVDATFGLISQPGDYTSKRGRHHYGG